jgi:hypothetical protein
LTTQHVAGFELADGLGELRPIRLGAGRLFLELGATGTHQLRILGQVLILVDTRAGWGIEKWR